MSVSVDLIPGPLTSQLTRSAAEAALRRHPSMAKAASYAIEQIDGRWVAAIVREAGPFGGPADSDEESPGPQSEGPSGDASPSPDDGDSDDGGSPDGPPKSHGDSEGGGEKGEIHHLMQIIQQIAEALGVPVDLGSSPVPGADPMAGGPAGPPGPPAPGGPPGPPGAGGPPGLDKKVHERALKPGETPPGGTPIGAPAFASVRNDHPWAHIAGKVASFKAVNEIGDRPMEDVIREVSSLAHEIGYKAKVREGRDQSGNRIAEAILTAH